MRLLFCFSVIRSVSKILISAVLLFSFFTALSAAPFSGQVVKLKQPDGTFVETKVWGDEYYQHVESLDGYALVRDGKTGWINYADVSADDGEFIPTGVIYKTSRGLEQNLSAYKSKDLADRMRSLKKGKKISMKSVMKKRKAAAQKLGSSMPAPGSGVTAVSASALNPGSAYGEVVGQKKGLIVLVDFDDCPATISKSSVEEYANQTGYTGNSNNGSIKDYFKEVSNDTLDYTHIVTVYYRAQYNKSYYTTMSYGGADTLVNEAIDYLGNSGFDFSQLTTFMREEKNCLAYVSFMYAGGIDNAWSQGLWPHYAMFYYGRDIPTTGYYLPHYFITNIGDALEIGTFIHESGHMVGKWPDTYDYGYDGVYGAGTGQYCLMSTGWGTNPLPPNPFFRDSAGWENVTALNMYDKGTYTVDANSYSSYKYINPDSYDREAFYIENRKNSGRSLAMPGKGMLIWHVDANGNNENQDMTPASHYAVSVEQADGTYDLERNTNSGQQEDYFYYGNNSSFDNSTVPSSKWWNGTASGFKVSNISAIGDTMSFVLPENTHKLNLQVKNYSQDPCTSSGYGLEIKVINNDEMAIDPGKLKIKMWFNSPDNININGCWGGEVRDAGGTWLGQATGSVAIGGLIPVIETGYDRKANREIAISLTSTAQLMPNGGSLGGVNIQLYRSSWASPFDDNCDNYSKPGTALLHEDMYFALYEGNALVSEWVSLSVQDTNTGREPWSFAWNSPTTTPSSTPTFTCTYTPTATATITATFSITATLGPCIYYDTAFGGTGVVSYNNPQGIDTGNAAVIDGAGRIVVAGKCNYADPSGDMAIWRYNQDGTPDTALNGTGRVLHNGAAYAGGNTTDEARDITIDPQGRILTTGTSRSYEANFMALWRYNPDGTPDTTFNGLGYVTVPAGYQDRLGNAVVCSAEGIIYVAGMLDTANMPGKEMVVWSYNNDGTVNTSFGSNGSYLTGLSQVFSKSDMADDMIMDSQGRLLIIGKSDAGTGFNQWRYVIWRLLPNGTMDATFNTTGYVAFGSGLNNYDVRSSISLDATGKILAAGMGQSGDRVWRFNENGGIDATFGGGTGYADISVASGSRTSVTADNNGKIITASSTAVGMEIHRLTSAGTADLTFNNFGYVRYTNGRAGGIIVDGTGRIVVAGSIDTAGGSSQLAVWRYKDICGIQPTVTITRTSTVTTVLTATNTPVITPTNTLTPVISATGTEVVTETFTATVYIAPTLTCTNTVEPSLTHTVMPSYTGTMIPGSTNTPSFTSTRTRTTIATGTPTNTRTRTSVITPTYTRTVYASPTVTPTTGQSSLRVKYYTSNTAANTNSLSLFVRVYNDTASAVSLSGVSVKYWYKFDGTAGTEIAELDYAGMQPGGTNITAYVARNIQTISQGTQDRVVVVTFAAAAGSVPAAGYAELQLRVHKNNWSNYTQTNDYSFGTHTAYTDWTKITAYLSGVKVWGTEPEMLMTLDYSKKPVDETAELISAANTYNYPNPCSDTTTIRFSLSNPGAVKLTISDLSGKQVRTITFEQAKSRAGINSVNWDLANDNSAAVANGTYILRVEAEGKVIVKKIAVVR